MSITVNVEHKGRYTQYPPVKQADGMQSLKKLFRIGVGPSSSHTMGPRKAASRFLEDTSGATHYRVVLYGSLAATGSGHMTDKAIIDELHINGGVDASHVTVVWRSDVRMSIHTNCVDLFAFTIEGSEDEGKTLVESPVDSIEGVDMDFKSEIGALDALLSRNPHCKSWYRAYSVGGGAIIDRNTEGGAPGTVAGRLYNKYHLSSMKDVVKWASKTKMALCDYVYECEGEEIKDHLRECWKAMLDAIERGQRTLGVLPGGLGLERKSRGMKLKAARMNDQFKRSPLLFSYALAVSEENAGGGIVVTAPTCGSAGVVPSVLKYVSENIAGCTESDIVNALAVAGLIGNLVKANASISGAEVGCQGEVGVACAMAAAAAVYLFGGSVEEIEYAAEMGIEHHLGLSCDPARGLVQVPCIERNAHAASRALDCCEYALNSPNAHVVSFDEAILAMKLTGADIEDIYRETGRAGLALTYRLDEMIDEKEQLILSSKSEEGFKIHHKV